MSNRLEQIAGGLLALIVLIDVFLTILYARIVTGFISYRVARWIWLGFRGLSKPLGPRRGSLLSFCGPVIMVVVFTVWALLLTLGIALIIHPALGRAVTANWGSTPTDFVSALYASGASMSIVGNSSFTPQTSGFRLLFLFNSLVGMSIISVTLMYLMQVYTALYHRNTTAFGLHLATGETGDAAEVIAGLGPEGQFSQGHTSLSDLAIQIAGLKESHHFYPVLFYFRFPEVLYSVSRVTLVALDAVSLIKSGLSDERYGWFKESAAVTEVWRGCLHLLTDLAENFLPEDIPSEDERLDDATGERWRRRYAAALRRLRQAGIETAQDERAGAEEYVKLRSRWHPHVMTLVPALAYSMEEIDPEGADPEASDHRPDFRARRHSPG